MSSYDAPFNGRTPDHYKAERDRQGNIRLRRGRGLLIAHPDHTRADVERWHSNASDPHHRRQYQAALDLLDREAVSTQGAHDA